MSFNFETKITHTYYSTKILVFSVLLLFSILSQAKNLENNFSYCIHQSYFYLFESEFIKTINFNKVNNRANDSKLIENELDTNVYIKTLKHISGQKIGKLLGIDIKYKFNEKYDGYYTYKLTNSGKELLHGKFNFYHRDSSKVFNSDEPALKNMVYIYKLKYSGRFINGNKYGNFIEELYHNDGVDLYSNWKIFLRFKDNICSSAKFIGEIGFAMPVNTTYNFKNIENCTFNNILKLVEEQWGKDWKLKNR